MSGVAPTRVELIYETDHTRVTRLELAGGTVIRKEPLGPDADARLHHEIAILERLRGVPGVAQLAREPTYPDSIVLEDAGRASLAELAAPIAVDGADRARRAAEPRRGGHARPRRDAPRHRSVEHRAVRGRGSVPGRLRAGDVVRRDPPRAHATQRDRRDVAVSRAGADRADGPAGRSARRPVRPRRDALRAGDGRAPVRFRRSVAAHARSPRAHTRGARRAQRGAPGRALADPHAPARERAGRPLPVGGGPAPRPRARCATPQQASRAHRGARRPRRGCCRRRGWWAASTKWRRSKRRSRRR